MSEKYTLVLLSGGSGTRMQMSVPKQYLMLGGKPVIVHVLECIDKINEIDEIVICANLEYFKKIEEYIVNFNLTKTKYKIIEAGETRQKTAYLGISNSKNNKVIIHEAARPFISKSNFRELIEDSSESIIFGIPIPFTVSVANKNLEAVLDRDKLINVQLPQKFLKKDLLEAFKKSFKDKKIFTEESSMLKYYYNEKNVKILEGNNYNLKITYPLDIKIGEVILKELLHREDF